LTDAGLKYVGKLTNLKNLSLGFTRISDSGIKYLVKLPLESLSLCSTDITDGALDHIARIKTLRYLNLSETNITDEGIQKLRSLRDLNDLHLMEHLARQFEEISRAKTGRQCSNYHTVAVRDGNVRNDSNVASLISKLPQPFQLFEKQLKLEIER